MLVFHRSAAQEIHIQYSGPFAQGRAPESVYFFLMQHCRLDLPTWSLGWWMIGVSDRSVLSSTSCLSLVWSGVIPVTKVGNLAETLTNYPNIACQSKVPWNLIDDLIATWPIFKWCDCQYWTCIMLRWRFGLNACQQNLLCELLNASGHGGPEQVFSSRVSVRPATLLLPPPFLLLLLHHPPRHLNTNTPSWRVAKFNVTS